jgi:hypothetical protein
VNPSTSAQASAAATGALRRVAAHRYVLALREGGSLPAIVEADDLGTYVLKFRGAGQGVRSLIAEIIVGELARTLALPVPELVLIHLDERIADAEPDEEVQDLIRASRGLNLGIDFLPGALDLAASVDAVDADLAARVMWLDAFTDNVDRTWRNPNLLLWHRSPWLIDHGAALYWHHDIARADRAVARPLVGAIDHVLRGQASSIVAADAALAPQVTREQLERILRLVPDEWIEAAFEGDDAATARRRYVDHLAARLAQRTTWVDDLEVTRAAAV